jgi:alpha-2-macroglobulin
LLGKGDAAAKLVEDISAELAGEHWHHTQAVAFALVSVARWAQAKPPEPYQLQYTLGGRRPVTLSADKPVSTAALPPPAAGGTAFELRNTSGRTLYATVALRGIARSGEEDAASQGLAIEVSYSDDRGSPVPIERLVQGSDLVAEVTVRNTSRRRLTNLALTHMVPAGWEIRNERLDGAQAGASRNGSSAPATIAWWIPDGFPERTRAEPEYVDVRDDRLMRYFSLRAGESIRFRTRLNAAYLGRYYLPGISAEAMYDATQHARLRGLWVEVVPRGR